MTIPRTHLFEFIDQPWYPDELRNLQTEGLSRFMGESFGVVAPLIRETMLACGTAKVVDLCSGSGGPWPVLDPLLGQSGTVDLTLTDAYPNPRTYERLRAESDGQIRSWVEPVEAQDVPSGLDRS